MSYSDLVNGFLLNSSQTDESPIKQKPELNTPVELSPLFSIDQFKLDLSKKTAKSNENFAVNSNRLNAYDIAHTCMRSSIFRILNYPVKDYSNKWLPITLRGLIGTACHEFLQENSNSFTETEIYLRIPSIKMSVKIDCLTNTDTLVEIKSCNYTDFAKILKTSAARHGDFVQALLYRHLLENYIEESKQQEVPKDKYSIPKHDKYNIKTIQMIYLCHELFAADVNSLDDAVKQATELKRQLKSKYNTMWFIKVLNYDVDDVKYEPHISEIKDKIKEANKFLDNEQIPPLTNKYVDKTKCFFCLYKEVCNNMP